jgi:hypothetical protein
MSANLEPKARLSRAEVEVALKALSPADWARAQVIAKSFCHGLIDWTPDDLLQESMRSLLDESRVWRPGLHPLVVLKVVMRSISSNARKHNDLNLIDENVVVDPLEPDEDDRTPVAHGTFTVTPEDVLSGKQQMVALYAALGGDKDLEELAEAWANGFRGADAREVLGWDEKKYDATRNRLLRRLKTLDPDRRPT